ncbi:MAG: riboflavin kinase [bacterium]|nr:riboflavin kinase [bacterium]
MIIETYHIKGKGRGKKMGFPTINLRIPYGFVLDDGIYASIIDIKKKKYKGALHYGPIPTFNDNSKNLEVYIIDAQPYEISEQIQGLIQVEIKDKIRDISTFTSPEFLAHQIADDVNKTNMILDK